MSTTIPGKITPQDIEDKIRGVLPDPDERVGPVPKDALPVAAAAAIVMVAAVVGVAFLLGRRKGRRRSTFVEITRI